MEALFAKYTKLYNDKYKKNIKFSGKISGIIYPTNNNYYNININLIVRDYNDEIIYDYNKDFHLNKTLKYNIFMNQYELINIFDDLDVIVNL